MVVGKGMAEITRVQERQSKGSDQRSDHEFSKWLITQLRHCSVLAVQMEQPAGWVPLPKVLELFHHGLVRFVGQSRNRNIGIDPHVRIFHGRVVTSRDRQLRRRELDEIDRERGGVAGHAVHQFPQFVIEKASRLDHALRRSFEFHGRNFPPYSLDDGLFHSLSQYFKLD